MLKFFFSIYNCIIVTVKAVIICSLCCLYTANAQQYGFLNYTTDNGLAQSQVSGMCQDNYGYLWFSTWGGVSRFDGIEFKNYSTASGLLNNQVHSVFHDSNGRIWFGCMGGYSVYHKNRFVSKTFKDDLSQTNLVAICEFPKNTMWLLFEKSTLIKLTGNKFTTFTLPDTTVKETRGMVTWKNDQIMLATDNGVYSFNIKNNAFEKLENLSGLNCSYITANANNLAVSTFGEGLFIYENQRVEHKLTKESGLTIDAIRHLFYDKDNNLWVSTISGVSLITPDMRITNFNSSNGLVNNNIRFTGQDNEGNIWFGTDGKGLIKFTGKSVLNYTRADGLGGDLVMSILQAGNGAYWFATYNDGVTVMKNGAFRTFNEDKDGLANNVVWSLAETPDDKIWMGTSAGLSVFDGKKITSYYEEDGLLSDKITSLYVDQKGKLWIGNKRGLNCFYDNVFSSFGEKVGIRGGNIRSIVADDMGYLWLGGSAGLYRFDGKKAVLFKYNKKVDDNTVYSLRFDKRKNLWVGTGEGLMLFRNGTFVPIEIPNDAIAGDINFLIDDKENLWVGTNSGVFEMDLNAYYTTDTVIVKSFGRNEGLKGRETNMNAVYRDHYNNLWFGTDGGLVKIGKERFSIDSKSLPFVHINDVKIFFEKPNWKKLSKDSLNDFGFPDYVSVKHNQNHFTFYFTGISHTQPQKIRYKFMLEGYDQTWCNPTETRYITYTNLQPGLYKFKVMAQNANGLWSKNPATFEFFIIAPFWKTWWFYSLCGLLVVMAFYALWQFRMRQIKRKNQTMQLFYKSKLLSLEQQSLNASMNRHFIFNSLNSIQYYINKQDKLEANKYLTNFAKLIRKNLDSSISGDLHPLSEEIDRIKLYLSLETMRFKDRFDFEINVAPELNPDTILIPPMLFQPYIENSIWHGILPKEGYKGHIKINITSKNNDSQLVEIEIIDDGIGISTSLNNKIDTGSTHISRGIEITSGRLSLLKEMTDQNLEIIGPIDITDASGKTTGTSVKLIISVKFPSKMENFQDKVYEN
ncbi:MAG TPA: two-component regulator propeller domain-containing protein [Flavobacteriales bacterium]|nr:two-component regulator propeller domain-containing protein [Flavobacteriales bacterium]